jgi:hypothetical protein
MAMVAILSMSFSVQSATVAYWRFEIGPAYANVSHPVGDGCYYQSVNDISGNGNHLSVWSEGGGGGYAYRTDVSAPVIPRDGAANNFSAKNTGTGPTMFTSSSDSHPSSIDIENTTFSAFTIEAFFKPETGGWRTIVGRDAKNVASSDGRLPALSFKISPENSVVIQFADVSGNLQTTWSAAGLIQGFDFNTDPDGLTGKWYYMAAVSDGTTLSLYLANMTDRVLQLVAQTNMSGSPNTAMAKGTVSGNDWHAGGWSVGRGLFDGGHTDRAYGFIDEVRISNAALPTYQLLFAGNPVMAGSDPDTQFVGDTAWMYPTSVSSNYQKFFAYSSTNLINWQAYASILDISTIGWIPSGKFAWAPGITKKNGMYYLYYSVGPQPSYIGVAYSSSPAGPFTDSGGALLSDASGFEAIDAMVFTDPQSQSGQSYLYAGGSGGSTLRVYKLNADMKSIANRVTPVATPTNYTEAPFMHYRNGIYYLSYSHGLWSDATYSVHYSTSSSPTGPWTYKGAILVSDSRHIGPGHHSFRYNAATQEWHIFYHRWNHDNPTERMIAIEKVQYEQNGNITPIVMTDMGVGSVVLQGPSRADFNTDGVVDFQDLRYFAEAWLTSNATADIAPVVGDGIVNLQDFAWFASQWR